MKKPNNEKIIRYAHKLILIFCILVFAWLFLYLKSNVYEVIYADSEFIAAQSQVSKEKLNSKELEAVFADLKKRSEKKLIFNVNDIFN